MALKATPKLDNTYTEQALEQGVAWSFFSPHDLVCVWASFRDLVASSCPGLAPPCADGVSASWGFAFAFACLMLA